MKGLPGIAPIHAASTRAVFSVRFSVKWFLWGVDQHRDALRGTESFPHKDTVRRHKAPFSRLKS